MLESVNFSGLIIGAVTFLIIGIFHPIVVKAEYYFGKQCWWVFVVLSIITTAISLIVKNDLVSVIMGALSFSLLWSIIELYDQEKRVLRGWFPMNPKRKAYYESIREKINYKKKLKFSKNSAI